MSLTRREFLKNLLVMGGALPLSPVPIHAKPQDSKNRWVPAYARLEQEGRLARRIEQAYAIFENCRCCPRQCGVNRREGIKGFCRAPYKAVIYSFHPHFGEEIPLVGRSGSGTIFFSNCNLRCVFCQNWPIAHEGRGKEVTDADLADMMSVSSAMPAREVQPTSPSSK